jgi:hypothetical protein
MAGRYPRKQLAKKLGHPFGSVVTKAHDLKLSLSYHPQRQRLASLDPGGMDLTG